jgi:hypothetical protein
MQLICPRMWVHMRKRERVKTLRMVRTTLFFVLKGNLTLSSPENKSQSSQKPPSGGEGEKDKGKHGQTVYPYQPLIRLLSDVAKKRRALSEGAAGSRKRSRLTSTIRDDTPRGGERFSMDETQGIVPLPQ